MGLLVDQRMHFSAQTGHPPLAGFKMQPPTVSGTKEEMIARIIEAAQQHQQQGNAAARRLVALCCGNPAQLRSVAALCKKKGAAPALAYLEQCRQKLRHAKLPGAEGYGTLFDALAGSLGFLREQDAALAERCTMLAVFPEDSQVPLSVVGRLWGTDEVETEEVVTELESWHLVDVDWSERRKVGDASWEWEGRTLSLIDLHLDYLRASAKDDLARWHAALLRRCGRRVLGQVEEGRADDEYWSRSRNVWHHMAGCGEELAAVMCASGSLAHLDLGGNKIGDEGAKAIAAGVAASGSLTHLELQGNEIGNEGAKALAAGVAASGSLTRLWLSSNEIGDEGAKALAAAVAVSGSLTEIQLDGEAMPVKQLKGSKKVSLSNKRLGSSSAIVIAKCIEVNGSLRKLNLYNNSIGEAGTAALASAATDGALPRLRILNLAYNRLGDGGVRALAAAIAGGALARRWRGAGSEEAPYEQGPGLGHARLGRRHRPQGSQCPGERSLPRAGPCMRRRERRRRGEEDLGQEEEES